MTRQEGDTPQLRAIASYPAGVAGVGHTKALNGCFELQEDSEWSVLAPFWEAV